MNKENKPYKPFRLGRKQERVILNDEGLEVCTFHEKNKHLAPKVVDFLNEFVTGRKNESKEELTERAIESSRKLYEMHNGMKYHPHHADGYPHLKNHYISGIDPASDIQDTSKIAIRYADGRIERIYSDCRREDNIDRVSIEWVKSEKTVELYIEDAEKEVKHRKVKTPTKNSKDFFSKMIRDLEKKHGCTEKMKAIKAKSELNVIKYRRK